MSKQESDDAIPGHLKMATIALLTNPNCRAKLETLDCVSDMRKQYRQRMKQDIRFYRKRIMTVFKDILMRRDNPMANERTRCAFDEFVRVLIEEFKMADTADIIQTELDDGDDHEGCDDTDGANTAGHTGESGRMTVVTGDVATASSTDKVISYANEFLTSSKTAPVTMDKFVIKRQLDEPVSNSVEARHRRIRNVPPLTKVDLREPGLRTKGVPPKKENVNSVYDNGDDKIKPFKEKEEARKAVTKASSKGRPKVSKANGEQEPQQQVIATSRTVNSIV